MKRYQQIHLLCYDRGFKYEPVPIHGTPFNSLEDIEEYVKNNIERIQDANFYKDPIVIVRRETNSVQVKEL